LGLTWANLRARITRKGVPDQALSAVETSVPVAKKLAAEGPAGAVKEIEAEAGNLKATILEKLTSYLIPTVIVAGITWIISLLNPASAFVRAVKGIIDIVTFIVNQGAQIIEFVNAVLDSVIAIANGGTAGVPKMIETALAVSVPVLIGFLASLLGIGNLANKVKSVFHAVAKPVNRAIDKIVGFIVKKGKALWNKLKGKGKGRKKEPGKSDRKARERGKSPRDRGNVRAPSPRGRDANEKDTAGDKGERLRRAVSEAKALMNGKQRLSLILNARLGAIKRKYRLTELRAVRSPNSYAWKIFAKVNPEAEFKVFSLPDEARELRAAIGAGLRKLPSADYHGERFLTEVKKIVDGMPQVQQAKKDGFELLWEPMSDDMCVLFAVIDGKSVDPSPIGYVQWLREYVDLGKEKGEHKQNTWAGDPDANNLYVHDQGKQKTPRFVVRNTTPTDRENIESDKGIPKKKVTRPVSEAQHVAGHNGISPWVSATTVPSGDVRNPHGDLFGKKSERIRIDLAYINSNDLRNLTTSEGHQKFILSKKPDRMVRAVRDAVRTQEVLIFGAIPANAIEHLSGEDVDAARATYKARRAQYFGKGDGVLKVKPGEDE
ncbi:hypothetical protein AB0L71_23080, partial [Streptomyces sp. NPDC052052]